MHPVVRIKPACAPLAIIVCGLMLALGACTTGGQPAGGAGSGVPSPSEPAAATTASANSGICAEAAALRASVAQLTTVTLGPGMGDEISFSRAVVSK